MAGVRMGLSMLLLTFSLALARAKDTSEDACDSDASSLLEHKSKPDQKVGTECTTPGMYHFPNMEGFRIEVSRWEHCQSYCRVTEGCQFFSYWPDGGCELQSGPGEFRKASTAYSAVISGPASCGDVEPGTINLLDMSFLYCMAHPDDGCCTCGSCCLPFCSSGHWTLRAGCNYKARSSVLS